MRKVIAAICLILLGHGCGRAPEPISEAYILGSVSDIYHALASHEFARFQKGWQGADACFFLEIQGADPDPAFLARFAGHDPAVVPVSLAVYEKGGVYHKDTGRRGLVFSLNKITWESRDRVLVDWEYFRGNLDAAGYHATLVLKHNGWQVTRQTELWIS